MMLNTRILGWLIALLSASCSEDSISTDEVATVRFKDPILVTIQGYEGHVMEPFLSRDGTKLFFNNLNTPTENTNLYWCTKINDMLFQYEGEVDNVNTPSLEGVPTMDKDNRFYFVYTGEYEATLASIYQGEFSDGGLSNPVVVDNISKNMMGWVNFDVEVTEDGKTLYFVDGRFDSSGGPHEANIVIAQKEGNQFARVDNSGEILQEINTDALEYAAAITKDELEICFTRVAPPLTSESSPKIYIASRENTQAPFTNVHLVENLTGFVEAATYTPDDQAMYFHKKEEGLHRLYYVQK
ncbi:MAG: hypothetical protein ACFB0B_08635 [Thermonemataceae bacterium]